MPPLFADVQAVPGRLTRQQAIDLSKKSVFRWYQIDDKGCDGSTNIKVPGYPFPIERKQQLVPTPYRVEQIVPELPNPSFFNPDIEPDHDPNVVEEFIQNYYAGYSKDAPAVAYGSFYVGCSSIVYVGVHDENTPGDLPIQIPFTVNQDYQYIEFEKPVYYLDTDRIIPAEITLECAMYVREKDTNAFACFTLTRPLGTPIGQAVNGLEVIKKNDVQLNVIGRYNFQLDTNEVDFNSILTGANVLEADPLFRANFYLDAHMLKYQIKQAQTADYNGIVPYGCDGAISQATYSVGGGQRASTVISMNCEHSTVVPNFPARRRAENLRPAQQDQIREGANPQRIEMADEPE